MTALQQIAAAFNVDGGLLDVHADPDHHRSVFTIAGAPGTLAEAVVNGAAATIERVDLNRHDGIHPRVGALDVAPIVFLTQADRGAACAEALVVADLLGHECGLPVFLYGILAHGRTRAEVRRGGPPALKQRIESGSSFQTSARRALHPTAGAVLVGARQPLIAFNVELRPPATIEDAKRIAAAIREGGPEGLVGVRAIGLWLDHRGVAQVSTNVEDHHATPLEDLIDAIANHAEPIEAELVGWPNGRIRGLPGKPSGPQQAPDRRHALSQRARGRPSSLRGRLSSLPPWPRPNESAAASIAEPPQEQSRPAGAPAAHRVPRSARSSRA